MNKFLLISLIFSISSCANQEKQLNDKKTFVLSHYWEFETLKNKVIQGFVSKDSLLDTEVVSQNWSENKEVFNSVNKDLIKLGLIKVRISSVFNSEKGVKELSKLEFISKDEGLINGGISIVYYLGEISVDKADFKSDEYAETWCKGNWFVVYEAW